MEPETTHNTLVVFLEIGKNIRCSNTAYVMEKTQCVFLKPSIFAVSVQMLFPLCDYFYAKECRR